MWLLHLIKPLDTSTPQLESLASNAMRPMTDGWSEMDAYACSIVFICQVLFVCPV